MIISKNDISSRLLYLIFFLSFIGYYSILIISLSLGIQETRWLTMPLRISIVVLMGLLFVLKTKSYALNKYSIAYLFFSLIYGFRLFQEFNFGSSYYIGVGEVFQFYLTFSFIPFVLISCYKLSQKDLHKVSEAFFASGLLFTVAVLYFYSKYIGIVSRLSSNFVDEQVVSPLILSYCSILIIGIFLCNIIFKNYETNRRKRLYILGIIFSAVPFILGASRGSLIALTLSIVSVLFFGTKGKMKLRLMIICVIGAFAFLLFDSYVNSGILERFNNLTDGDNSRSFIWKSAFNQFLDNPIFGDKLQIDNWDGYAHNIIIEVLYTTGIIGAIPFFYLIVGGFKISISLLRENKKLAWVSVVFFQSLFQFMFSGNLYIAAWLWLSLAFLVSIYNSKRKIT